MTTTVLRSVEKPKSAEAESTEPVQSVRETVESIVVAFILAFLFRAFVAEAFVIPTGSMAPTLMGVHKDIVCEHCGKQYQSSASQEYENDVRTHLLVVASTCPTCRGLNAFDLENNANHLSFSGDRILVSKFDYVLHNPQRWDVIVFKYPLEARMNYIKRLVGLPGEQLRIKGGDVYVRTEQEQPWTIARKPPHKIRAMRQIVADTKHQPAALISAGWPSLWQPHSTDAATESNWKITNVENAWSAALTASDKTQWLRYYHKFLTSGEWQAFQENHVLAPVDPLSSRLITDYQAYNTSYTTLTRNVYDDDGKMLPSIRGVARPYDALQSSKLYSDSDAHAQDRVPPLNDSEHWVGDLSGDFDVQIGSSSGTVSLMLVEYGIEFRCDIDVATGNATLRALDGDKELALFSKNSSAETQLTANTSVKGPGSYHLEIANFDDQIVVWVNGKVVAFDALAEFSYEAVRSDKQRRPHWTETNPLDAAPVAIGAQATDLAVERARVWRDIYYIALDGTSGNYTDFPIERTDDFIAAIPDVDARNAVVGQTMERSQTAILAIYSHPEWWSKTRLFDMRGERFYELSDDHYFPMGDNSAQSLDARAWRSRTTGQSHNFVEQRFMLGKALLVFWPHCWNRPIPFLPNFSRMGLIR